MTPECLRIKKELERLRKESADYHRRIRAAQAGFDHTLDFFLEGAVNEDKLRLSAAELRELVLA